MEPALTSLVAAAIAFVGSHVALSHPLRAPLVRALGAKGFLALYSLVALATLGWMILAFRAAPPGGSVPGEAQWILATILTLIAAVLLVGSFKGNPALPDTPPDKIAVAEPQGVFRVTRHPMMWSFALWALGHMILSWSQRTSIFAAAILVLALLGSHLQDRKKRALLGDAWNAWEAKTSHLPRLGQLGKVGPVPWLAGLVLWLAATWAHIPTAYIPAGIWKWLI